jgi:hypothetical protein
LPCAIAAAPGAAAPPAAPLDVPPLEVPPLAATLEPPAATAAEAGATAAATGEVWGGERLPGAGNCPPVDPLPWALFAAGLRLGLEPALLSAAAKSWPPALRAAKSALAGPLAGAGSMWMGACETVGIAFIPTELASDVPSLSAPPAFQGVSYGLRLNFKTRVAHPSNPVPSIKASQRFMLLDIPNLADACSAR